MDHDPAVFNLRDPGRSPPTPAFTGRPSRPKIDAISWQSASPVNFSCSTLFCKHHQTPCRSCSGRPPYLGISGVIRNLEVCPSDKKSQGELVEGYLTAIAPVQLH